MSVVNPSGRINLRCPRCGTLRRPFISPLIPDHVVVICDECDQRRLREMKLDWTPEPGGQPPRMIGWGFRV